VTSFRKLVYQCSNAGNEGCHSSDSSESFSSKIFYQAGVRKDFNRLPQNKIHDSLMRRFKLIIAIIRLLADNTTQQYEVPYRTVPPNDPDLISSFMCNQNAMLAQQRTRTFSQTEREQQLRRRQQQPGVGGREKASSPPAELSESHEWMRLAVDLPGVQLKDLDVNINHGVLTIEGSRRTMSVDGSVCVKKQKISRRYAIDGDVVDLNNATANLKFGVLTIKAPKKSKPNRVRVDVTEDDEGDTSAALT
jgi:HSP20 family molecular chaperone IbpA